MAREVVPRAKPSARPRYRYVLVEVAAPHEPSRSDLITAIRRATPPGAPEVWLTRYDGRFGVLRTLRGHEGDDVAAIVQGLAQAGIALTTLSTSGTIAALERRHRDQVPRQRPR